MKYPTLADKGFIYESNGRVYLNEDKLFRSLSYEEVLELDFESTSIDHGKIKLDEVEAFFAKRNKHA